VEYLCEGLNITLCSDGKEQGTRKYLREYYFCFNYFSKKNDYPIIFIHQSMSFSPSDENDEKMNRIVKLNVGGQRFETTMNTLISHKKSYFYHLLSSNKFKPDKNEEYFLDRSPEYFNDILYYLRTGLMNWNKFKDDFSKISFFIGKTNFHSFFFRIGFLSNSNVE
jgi:hypothetical protein